MTSHSVRADSASESTSGNGRSDADSAPPDPDDDGGERSGPPPKKVAVPSFFTLLNLFCGFLALTQILEGAFGYACWLIVLAGFFDALDGLMARLADVSSSFGVELDSLSDVVSFGVAPSFLVYAYGLQEFGPLGMLVAALPALCGAVRLARYNVGFEMGSKDDYYEGLPVPAQATTLVTLILTLWDADWFSRVSQGHLSILIPVVLTLAGLMVSKVRFDAFPKPTASYVRAHPYKSGAYAIGLVLLPFLQELAIFLFMVGYIALGIGDSTYRFVQKVRGGSGEDDGSPAEEGVSPEDEAPAERKEAA